MNYVLCEILVMGLNPSSKEKHSIACTSYDWVVLALFQIPAVGGVKMILENFVGVVTTGGVDVVLKQLQYLGHATSFKLQGPYFRAPSIFTHH